jgi:hypothetical protein
MRALSRRGASTPSVSNVSGYLESADAQQRNSIPASPAIPAAAKQQEDENKDDKQRCIVHETRLLRPQFVLDPLLRSLKLIAQPHSGADVPA